MQPDVVSLGDPNRDAAPTCSSPGFSARAQRSSLDIETSSLDRGTQSSGLESGEYQPRGREVDVAVDVVSLTSTQWDTAGQEVFRALTAAYFRSTQGVVAMFDLSNTVQSCKLLICCPPCPSHSLARRGRDM